MIGIGSDLVELDRFRLAMTRTPRMVDRVFSLDEQDYARQRPDPTERFAARFAAKEAVLKALGVGLWRLPLRDIEVVRAASGAPSILLHGKAAELAAQCGVTEWRLTMSHTATMASATAVAL